MLAEEILPICSLRRVRSAPSAAAARFMSAERNFSFICAAAFFVNVTASTPSRSPPPEI